MIATPKLPATTIGELRDLLCEWILFFGPDAPLIGQSGFGGVQVEAVYTDPLGLIVGTRLRHHTAQRWEREAIALRQCQQLEQTLKMLEAKREAATAAFPNERV